MESYRPVALLGARLRLVESASYRELPSLVELQLHVFHIAPEYLGQRANTRYAMCIDSYHLLSKCVLEPAVVLYCVMCFGWWW